MKHQICGIRAVLEWVAQSLRRQELDSDVLKSPLLGGHILHVMKIVLTRCGKLDDGPYAMDGAVAHKSWRYQFTAN